ncbi:MAG: phosphopyruvate hydratase [Christensenellales bacterium]
MEEKNLITKIWARQILDSRGNPTVEVDVYVDGEFSGRASVPSGASTGKFEAIELRDGDKDNYLGKSVEKAVKNVNKIISKEIVGMCVFNQEEIDRKMIALDGTENKGKLGANAILGVSLACAKAGANKKGLSLFRYLKESDEYIMPVPMMNVVNGGKHADNNVNIQEFMIMPVGAKSWSEALKMCVEVFHNLKSVLKQDGYATSVGDEGGFAPNFKNDEEVFEYLVKAVKKAGYKLGKDFMFAIDVAGSEMKNEAIKKGKDDYYFFWKTGRMFTTREFIDYFKELIDKYPIISIEDAFGEENFEDWKLFNKELGDKIQIVGDDLYVTNIQRLNVGIDQKLSNSILIKVNQIGTLTETIETINKARENNFTAVVSHRSGETEDTTIADLVVALSTGQIKTGAPSRTDRVAKYNQLIRIEEELNKKARYLGKRVFTSIKK